MIAILRSPFSAVLTVVAVAFVCGSAGFPKVASAQEAKGLASLAPDVLDKEQQSAGRGAIDLLIRKRTDAFNAEHRKTWKTIQTREQWERYRDERIERLRRSLGVWPAPGKPNVKVTGVVRGDGFVIENLVYETRPGFWVDANLYVPSKPGPSMPGILIAHSHHGGKRDSELQDMGMTWARAGCQVLVLDQVGYGERRSHPFHRDSDYAKPYKTSRQDYYFRYDSGIQLQLLGDSLMGWMVWDLQRGVDLLLAREGTDPQRILILGAVAGGGDPAGVAAALDPRISCCVPFNFGGSQPETKFPLPEDAESTYDFLVFTYWDSTRGLRLGARDEFPHWLIVASTAPRRLIHAHEFSWDKERDPVWKRYQRIWGDFYGAGDRLGAAHGKGVLKLRPPEASHCNNIGEFHRRMIHPLFERWFDIKATEYHAPRKGDELICLTEEARKGIQPKSLTETMTAMATERVEQARARLEGKSPEERRRIVRDDWSRLLGPTAPEKPATVLARATDAEEAGGAKIERVVLEVEPGIVLPVLILSPQNPGKSAPVVVGVAQAGKAGFLKEREESLRTLLRSGAVVVLPDLRGTGEMRAATARGKESGDVTRSVYVQLFGETVLGQRLRDLRSVLAFAKKLPNVDAKRIALWGDSFVSPNGSATDFKAPHGVEGEPTPSEPMGGLLALLGALYEDDVRAVLVSGGLTDYRSVLGHFAVLIPHDASVPGALTAGDLCDLAGALAPRALHFENMVDAKNQRSSAEDVRRAYAPTLRAYGDAAKGIAFGDRPVAGTWLSEHLR